MTMKNESNISSQMLLIWITYEKKKKIFSWSWMKINEQGS